MGTSNYVRDNREWLERAARAGYVARGAVFLIIGYFAFRAAFASGEAMSSKEAVDQLLQASVVLVWLLVLAFASFSLWRIGQSLLDVDGHGTGAKGLAVRAGLLGSAFTYGALAVYAGSLAVGSGASSDGGAQSGFVASAYEAGYGVWLTYLIALVVIGVGGAHIFKGATAGFEKYMTIPPEHRKWLKATCQFGLIARGLTFFVIAWLLIRGASSYSSGDTPGLKEALTIIASWPYGWALLSLTGLGLIAFGVYGLLEATYRRINVEAAV